MNKKIEKILGKFGGFDVSTGYRMMMLIDRTKRGNEKNRSIRKVSKNKEEFIKNLEFFLKLKKPHERIYSCVNERDVNKAIRIFKQNQLDADYQEEELRNNFYQDIKNRWISSLMQPQARKERWFLIDIDTKEKEEVDKIVYDLGQITRNYVKYETENGWHIICSPFNPSLLPNEDIKKDGLVLLDY